MPKPECYSDYPMHPIGLPKLAMASLPPSFEFKATQWMLQFGV